MNRLTVFDFDGTLIDTHTPELGKPIWEKHTGLDWPHVGWWSKPESIDTKVFDIKPIKWVLDKYTEEISDEYNYVFLATGRMRKLQNEVQNILDIHNIKFQEVICSWGGETFAFKIKLFEQMISKHNPTTFTMYDDRHLEGFTEWAKLQKTEIIIFDSVKQIRIF
jgi:hypothetical protein